MTGIAELGFILHGQFVFGIVRGSASLGRLDRQWVGVMAMRDERNGAWWTMMIGTAMSTIGALGTIASMVLLFTNMRASGMSGMNSSMMVFAAVAGMHTLGGLVFAAGFAMHGLRRKAAREREQQLETIAAAMGEELRVAREPRR